MSEIAIKIEDLSLIFSLSDSGPKQIFRTFLGPIGKKIFGKGRSFTALRNIDFELRKGEVLGLIGNNVWQAFTGRIKELYTQVKSHFCFRVLVWVIQVD